jgi:hypothetical protein
MALRWANKQQPFLGNSSVNTFPLQRISTQQQKNGVLYMFRSEKLEQSVELS